MRTIRSVLVANRGEIAVRVIRACREMDIESVQAHSIADADSLAVRLADRAVCIGAAPAGESYRNANALLAAAQMTGVDAVHPGYGFLSESAAFAEACERAGLAWIGPDAGVIRLMGDKCAARRLAAEAGVPVVPGSERPVRDVDDAAAIAARVGYPLLIKASAGGGGRGMRVVADENGLRETLQRASAEAESAFGSGDVYVEKFLPSVRHVEVQVFGDGKRVVHLGERDCTIQRRHQKLLEESPSPALSPQLRSRMLECAVALARRVAYRGAGTVEFVLDAVQQQFHFIEMNTRIQVEHPVTEMRSGLDLVKLQLRIAGGDPLPIDQDSVRLAGHVIECRINAEDPDRGFLPAPGKLDEFVAPLGPGVRVDTHAYAGYALPPHYDSLVAKVLAHGQTRAEALARMRRALDEMRVGALKTTLGFHRRLLREPDFLDGRFDTQFVRQKMWAGHPAQHLL